MNDYEWVTPEEASAIPIATGITLTSVAWRKIAARLLKVGDDNVRNVGGTHPRRRVYMLRRAYVKAYVPAKSGRPKTP